jgi:hypothetical protein
MFNHNFSLLKQRKKNMATSTSFTTPSRIYLDLRGQICSICREQLDPLTAIDEPENIIDRVARNVIVTHPGTRHCPMHERCVLQYFASTSGRACPSCLQEVTEVNETPIRGLNPYEDKIRDLRQENKALQECTELLKQETIRSLRRENETLQEYTEQFKQGAEIKRSYRNKLKQLEEYHNMATESLKRNEKYNTELKWMMCITGICILATGGTFLHSLNAALKKA